MQMSVDITIKLFSGLTPPHFWKREPRFSNFFLTLNFIASCRSFNIADIFDWKRIEFWGGKYLEKKAAWSKQDAGHVSCKMKKSVGCHSKPTRDSYQLWSRHFSAIPTYQKSNLALRPSSNVVQYEINSRRESDVASMNWVVSVYVSQTGIYDGAYLK